MPCLAGPTPGTASRCGMPAEVRQVVGEEEGREREENAEVSHFERPCGSEADSSNHSESHCGPERARAAMPNPLAAPGELALPFRAPTAAAGTEEEEPYDPPASSKATIIWIVTLRMRNGTRRLCSREQPPVTEPNVITTQKTWSKHNFKKT